MSNRGRRTFDLNEAVEQINNWLNGEDDPDDDTIDDLDDLNGPADIDDRGDISSEDVSDNESDDELPLHVIVNY